MMQNLAKIGYALVATRQIAGAEKFGVKFVGQMAVTRPAVSWERIDGAVV